MIKLDTHYYCQNCPDFIPVLQDGITAAEFFGDTTNTNHRVVCIHRNKCLEIYKHIKKETSKNAE